MYVSWLVVPYVPGSKDIESMQYALLPKPRKEFDGVEPELARKAASSDHVAWSDRDLPRVDRYLPTLGTECTCFLPDRILEILRT